MERSPGTYAAKNPCPAPPPPPALAPAARVHEHMVHDGSIARKNLRRLDPLVLGEMGVDAEDLIAQHAVGFDVIGFVAHRQDQVGRPILVPAAGGKRRRRRQFFQIALRRSGCHPGVNQPLLVVRQPAVVGKMAVLRIGVPRRHPALIDDFGDHFGPGGRVLIAGERERGDVACVMAFDAALVEEPRDLVGIRDLGVRLRLVRPADQATDRLRAGHRDASPRQQRVDRVFEFTVFRRLAGKTDAVLVVDPPLIADDAGLVEHEDFGRPRRAKLCRDAVFGVAHDRKSDSRIPRVGGQRGQ